MNFPVPSLPAPARPVLWPAAVSVFLLLAMSALAAQPPMTYDELMRRARGLPPLETNTPAAAPAPAVRAAPAKIDPIWPVANPAPAVPPAAAKPEPEKVPDVAIAPATNATYNRVPTEVVPLPIEPEPAPAKPSLAEAVRARIQSELTATNQPPNKAIVVPPAQPAIRTVAAPPPTKTNSSQFSDVPIEWMETGVAPTATAPPPMAASAAPAPTPTAVVASAAAPVTESPTNAMATLDDKHRLAIGDRLSFRIVEDEEDPRPLVVTDSGELEVPYLGRVAAEGKTCKELALILKTELEKEYYYHATVIVAVDLMTRSRGKVYLVGPVRMPGPQDIPSDEVFTLSKAILRAGGFTDFADKKTVKVTRKAEGGGDQVYTINVEDILENGRRDADLPLQPGDLVYIQERMIRF